MLMTDRDRAAAHHTSGTDAPHTGPHLSETCEPGAGMPPATEVDAVALPRSGKTYSWSGKTYSPSARSRSPPVCRPVPERAQGATAVSERWCFGLSISSISATARSA